MSDICSWGINYTFFCNYYYLRFLSPYKYQSESIFVGGGSTIDLDPAWDPYLGCTLWPEFRVHWVWLWSHLCLTLAHYGGQLQIWIQLQIYIWIVLFDLNLGSIPAPALVPSMSHLKSLWWGSILAPALVPSLSHLSWLWGGLLQKNWSQLHFLSTDSFLLRMIGQAHCLRMANEPKSQQLLKRVCLDYQTRRGLKTSQLNGEATICPFKMLHSAVQKSR